MIYLALRWWLSIATLNDYEYEGNTYDFLQ